MMPPKRHKQEDNVDSWLMSYADMITLLLCFFVIFIAISEPKKEKIQAITESMAGKFGAIDLATPFQGAYKEIQGVIEQSQLLKDMDVQRTKNGVIIEMSSGSFFKQGSIELESGRMESLSQIAVILKNIDFLDYRIVIEGHTSDEPVKNGAYPSNWEFSAAQAARLARYFVEQGVAAKRLAVMGFADSDPKVPNLDANGNAIMENRNKNERIVIRIDRVISPPS
jgi:chemotaxis protein MotB